MSRPMDGPALPATWTMSISEGNGKWPIFLSHPFLPGKRAFHCRIWNPSRSRWTLGGYRFTRSAASSTVVIPLPVVNWLANLPPFRSTLSRQERLDYIRAVQCLQTLPSQLYKLDPTTYSGARTRYDDFVGVHINQTMSIHLTVRLFLYKNFYFIPTCNHSADT
jgi:hypothetical protein